MAQPTDIDTDLTLELDGSEITPAKFRKGVIAFTGLLEAITKTVCKEAPEVEWRMDVKRGSLLIGANAFDEASPVHVKEIQDFVARGLAMFEESGDVPPVFSDAAIKYVRDLSALSASKQDDDTIVNIWVRKSRRAITPAINAVAKSALKSGYYELGTVEGRLSVLSERGETHFVIYEAVWDKPVKCVVPEKLIEKAMEYWRHRVAAHGEIRFRPDGIPTLIKADEIDLFPDDEKLPSHDDVFGILRIAG